MMLSWESGSPNRSSNDLRKGHGSIPPINQWADLLEGMTVSVMTVSLNGLSLLKPMVRSCQILKPPQSQENTIF